MEIKSFRQRHVVCFVFVGVKTDHILFPKYVETHINECVAEISLNAEIV